MEIQLGEYFGKILKRKARKSNKDVGDISFTISLKDDCLMFRFLDRERNFILNKGSENYTIEELLSFTDLTALRLFSITPDDLEEMIDSLFRKFCSENNINISDAEFIFTIGITEIKIHTQEGFDLDSKDEKKFSDELQKMDGITKEEFWKKIQERRKKVRFFEYLENYSPNEVLQNFLTEKVMRGGLEVTEGLFLVLNNGKMHGYCCISDFRK